MSYGFRACLNAVRAQRVSSKRTGNRKVQNRRRRRRRRVPVGAGGSPCRVRAAPYRCLTLPLPAYPLVLSHAPRFARFLGVLTVQYSFTWELLGRDPSQRSQTETKTETQNAPRHLAPRRTSAVRQSGSGVDCNSGSDSDEERSSPIRVEPPLVNSSSNRKKRDRSAFLMTGLQSKKSRA